ncbi:hypothetical protein K450DRAFT_240039 [Umbelopsis ramanniana AG]|uniref:mRNA export factor MEX67 n=1 Tax=Umbelopsis ramanniana AG TaxID=1314678 RepID=A0AAD5ECZ1_UMBRA|nr:uncharacterized protein K450DRAFT_240039 [Umbelopsis ramanniana AG]KAI8579985.1 hypothetical protein K450DRAFT_240039 [Umbelopsis ramanniana AG]
MSQPRGFAGMFGSAVAKFTDVRPLDSENTGMAEAGRKAGGKADRITRKARKQQLAKRPSKGGAALMSDDIEMKGTKPTGRGKFRRATFTRDVVHGAKEPKEVVITGWAEGTEHNLISFLQQKSKTPFATLAVQILDGSLHIMVENIVIAKKIQRLTGYAYENRQLSIFVVNDDPSLIEEGTGKSTVDVLRYFLSRRWNADSKYLNLEAIADDAILQDAGIEPLKKDDSNNVGSALMKLAGEMFPEVITISFARNQLEKLKPFSLLAKFIPNVQHISFQQNNINNVNQLSLLSGGGGKLAQLKELILTENPFREKFLQKDATGATYTSEVVKLFPNLQILDGVMIHNEKQQQDLPIPCLEGFTDSDPTRILSEAFVEMFFEAFDSNRSLCGNMYAPDAVFSVTTNMKLASSKALTKQERQAMKKNDVGTWESFHHKATSAKTKALKNICCGQPMITEVLPRLPTTKHNLNRKELLVDAFVINVIPGFANALQLSIHGDFTSEQPIKKTYSFDRTLLIAPSPPGSTSQMYNVPFIILNDQLCVRDYSNPDKWRLQTSTRSIAEVDVKQQMVAEVQKMTGLKTEFATQCLEENGWDVQQAFTSYQQLQASGTIPAEAYLGL